MTGDRSVSPSFFSEAATIGLFSDVDDETDRDCERRRHLLDSCFLCKRRLIGDIFMYRGDTPFCSEECREEQMELDEAEEVRRMCAWRKHQQQQLKYSGSPERKQVCGRAAAATGTGTTVAG